MPDRTESNATIEREIISVAEMADRLQLSRAHFYELMEQGFFLPPIFLLTTRRPFYPASLALRNQLAKETGIGANGQPRVFYRRRSNQTEATPTASAVAASRGRRNGANRSDGQLADFVAAMRGLGLSDVTEEQVNQAMSALFPSGPDGMERGDVLRAIYRHIRRQGEAR